MRIEEYLGEALFVVQFDEAYEIYCWWEFCLTNGLDPKDESLKGVYERQYAQHRESLEEKDKAYVASIGRAFMSVMKYANDLDVPVSSLMKVGDSRRMVDFMQDFYYQDEYWHRTKQ